MYKNVQYIKYISHLVEKGKVHFWWKRVPPYGAYARPKMKLIGTPETRTGMFGASTANNTCTSRSSGWEVLKSFNNAYITYACKADKVYFK